MSDFERPSNEEIMDYIRPEPVSEPGPQDGLIERLRELSRSGALDVEDGAWLTCQNAADELSRLTSQNAQLLTRLERCRDVLSEVQVQHGDTGSELDQRIESLLGVSSPLWTDEPYRSQKELVAENAQLQKTVEGMKREFNRACSLLGDMQIQYGDTGSDLDQQVEAFLIEPGPLAPIEAVAQLQDAEGKSNV